jgi:glyoxylase-like metal-dependent hydrolase (beta-lactamase superfamily II)
MFAIATIVEHEATGPRRKVTWEVTALPGFFARHTYHAEDLGNGQTRFGSWEKACGPSFEGMRFFWQAHFEFVCRESLAGARQLWAVDARDGKVDVEALRQRGALRRWARGAVAAATLIALCVAGWFYQSFVRLSATELAPGVYVVFGGGGNALVVDGGAEALVVDTKFEPGSSALRRWIAEHVRGTVKYVVDTHYHYDHTTGNDLYPGARIIAHALVPELMHENDAALWAKHPGGVPDPAHAVGQSPLRLSVGTHEVEIFHPGPAHTSADLCVYLPNENVLATGDLFFAGYYPFFDLGPGGVHLDGLVAADRRLAATYPDAIVVPGHGPLSSAAELGRYADYIASLASTLREKAREGETEAQAAASVDLSRWSLSILPSFHDGNLSWAYARANVRDVYALVKRDLEIEGRAVHASE